MFEEPAAALDVYEGDENEDASPGPGQYYDPDKATCFRKAQKEERLQFFGSTVERFAEKAKPVEAEVGPCSYNVANRLEKKKLVNPTIYSGFTSAEQRFAYGQATDEVPGPGQYVHKSLAQQLHDKVQTKKAGIFGSEQARFPGLKLKDLRPGPGFYHVDKTLEKAKAKKLRALRDHVKRSNSVYLQKQRASQMAQGSQSYVQQNEQAMREASKNYLNQIQYDDRTHTIAHRVNQRSATLLLKAKKGRGHGGVPRQPIAFGSRRPG